MMQKTGEIKLSDHKSFQAGKYELWLCFRKFACYLWRRHGGAYIILL